MQRLKKMNWTATYIYITELQHHDPFANNSKKKMTVYFSNIRNNALFYQSSNAIDPWLISVWCLKHAADKTKW